MNATALATCFEPRLRDWIRGLYLLQEPRLLAAIGRGDRGEARHIIYQVLVDIFSVVEEESDLLNSLLLELVVMISRMAGDTRAVRSELLRLNCRFLAELANRDNDKELAAWQRKILEHVISTVEQREDLAPPMLISKTLEFMRLNLHRDISRDETARQMGISPSQFSQILKKQTGRSFTELLRQCRIDHASEMLRETEKSIAEIADICGFCDQSYFTHVFQDVKGMTPKRFRAGEVSSRTHDLRKRLMVVSASP